MKLSTLAATFAAAVMLASCGVIKKTSTSMPSPSSPASAATPTETKPAAASLPLTGEWSIIEVAGKPVVVNGENHPKLSLQPAEGRTGEIAVIGYNGCNYINGVWEVKDTRLTPAGEFISSLMLCHDAPYESDINIALNTVGSFTIVDSENVTLNDVSGRPTLRLRKRNLSFLNGAWAVTSIEGQNVPASAGVNVVIDIDECRIHGNAGCNILNGDIIVNLDKGDGIEFKNLRTSRMMCPDIATEQAFLLALESVDNAVAGPEPDTAQLRNASQQTIITLRRLSDDEVRRLGE